MTRVRPQTNAATGIRMVGASGRSGDQQADGEGIAQSRDGGASAVNIVNLYQAAKAQAVSAEIVAAAKSVFAQLPLDHLPEPGDLPDIHTMPWPRNRHFTGREADLRLLARTLKTGGSAALAQSPAVTGLGGQGKTQLAVEFAYRYGRWFNGGVFFINCADRTAMANAIAACATSLTDDLGILARPMPDRVALVASAWAGPLPRLLIFDNCEDDALVTDWVPKSGGCRLLITARRHNWPAARGIAVLPLGRLKRAESVEMLCQHRPDLALDDAGLDGIAEELGDLPLALELAGSYLARYQDSAIGRPAAYLDELRVSDPLAHVSLIEDPEAPGGSRSLTGHERDVARTFGVSLNRLRPDDSIDGFARHLLAHAAWLAPGLPIPPLFLRRCVGLTEDEAETERRFADALGRLLALALVERTDNMNVNIHRLVALFVRTRLDPTMEIRRSAENNVAALTQKILLRDDPTPVRDWSGHLLEMTAAAARDGTDEAIALLNSAGIYSRIVADYESSLALLQQAVDRAERTFGVDSIQVAVLLTNLGNVQYQLGDLVKAETSQIRALEINERAFGFDHQVVARTLGNLGNIQQSRGKLKAAESSQARALEILEKTCGPNHPDVAVALSNLGTVQADQGRLEQAEISQLRALKIKEAENGPNHTEVASSLVNLGYVQMRLGRLQDAQKNTAQAATIYLLRLGDRHPYTAYTLTQLNRIEALEKEKRPWWRRLLRR